MPAIYVIDDSAPNAFATGRDPEHASVAITTGLMEKLSRDELQGVMAHELSHVGNRDILFATMVGIMVGSIVLIADFFLRSFIWGGGRRRSRDSRGGGGGAILVLIALLFAILAPLFAKLLQLAVSRQREYLADASAVKLTRYPEGLASALEKIARDREVLEVANRATQHLYIVNPIKPFEKRAKSLFSTHPPLEERVARLRSM
jgi:heat shock protein HtpX